ncbi:rRNA maturation RNase YbeY [Candidatus Woesebacteria bacterium]|nr:rRNA maturation RNase YbeY [Candidatus Woesebacteria bacterium]
MIKVYVKKQSNYPVDTYTLKSKVKDFLKEKGIVSDSQLTIAIVGEKKMKQLSEKYLNDPELHNVLSFVASEVDEDFKDLPLELNDLGDIIICYQLVIQEANRDRMLIDEKVYELAEHGILHLLGEHHD